MSRTAGRSAEDTRNAILDAAFDTFYSEGLQASVDSIARRAGISKGGLKYHFDSKDDLIEGLARKLVEGFHESVLKHQDPTDSEPGALMRGYINASFDLLKEPTRTSSFIGVMSILFPHEAAREIATADTLMWNEKFLADGLPADVCDLIVAASDGASVSSIWGEVRSPEQIDRLRNQLLSMTYLR